jgi:hypothetical protein
VIVRLHNTYMDALAKLKLILHVIKYSSTAKQCALGGGSVYYSFLAFGPGKAIHLPNKKITHFICVFINSNTIMQGSTSHISDWYMATRIQLNKLINRTKLYMQLYPGLSTLCEP